MKIKELPMDQKTTITLLLTSIEEKETRNSSPYCTLTLTDGIDTIIAQLWNTKKENVKVQEKTLILPLPSREPPFGARRTGAKGRTSPRSRGLNLFQ